MDPEPETTYKEYKEADMKRPGLQITTKNYDYIGVDCIIMVVSW
jgi:hypothetical protein